MCRVSPEASFQSSLRHPSPASHDDPKRSLWARSLHTTLRFLVLPHPGQVVGQLKCNLQCIVRKSARGPKGQQQHFAACLACLWHRLDWQNLLRLPSSCISMGSVSPYVPPFGAPSGVPPLSGVLNLARRSALQILNPAPGHSSCAYVVLLSRRLSFQGRVHGIDSY